MKTLGSFIKVLVLLSGSSLFVAVCGSSASAQNGRTFVSGTGLDTNPCSLTQPCRTFTQAISQTNAGGEVIVLTSAGYGPFTINKAITVEAPAGVYAGITVTSGDGIDITGDPSAVILRGLTVNNQGSGGNGVNCADVGTLHIESCIVNGFGTSNGLEIDGSGSIFVEDTTFRGNGSGISVILQVAGTTVNLAMDRVHLDANESGLFLGTSDPGAAVNAAIRNSSVSGNTAALGGGMFVRASAGAASLDIESCLVTNNVGDGIIVQGSGAATASISNCTISRNSGAGFSITSGGAIYSRGQNTLIGNGANTGALTVLSGQ
jgi:hypothetical protein